MPDRPDRPRGPCTFDRALLRPRPCGPGRRSSRSSPSTPRGHPLRPGHTPCCCCPPADRGVEQVPPSCRCPAATGTVRTRSALLRRLYPAEHPVLGPTGEPEVGAADGTRAAAAACTSCRPCRGGRTSAGPFGLPWLVHRLRGPDGCPWDREQDHLDAAAVPPRGDLRGLRRAGGRAPRRSLAEELGDLLLQIVLHAQYACRGGRLRPRGRPAAHHDEDHPPPSPRLRRRHGRARPTR